MVRQHALERLVGCRYEDVLVEETLEADETFIRYGIDQFAQLLARWLGKLHQTMTDERIAPHRTRQIAKWGNEVGVDDPSVREQDEEVGDHEPFSQSTESASGLVLRFEVEEDICFYHTAEKSCDYLVAKLARHDCDFSEHEHKHKQ